jgi:thioredoxin reductase (NADPH)
MLLEYTESVDFIEFLPHSIAEKILQDRTMNHPKSRFFFSHMVTEIQGDGNKVTSVLAKDRNTDEVKEIPADGVFIYVGYAPYTKFVEGQLDLNRLGYIETDAKMRTSVEGIYAVGDVRANNPAQVSISVGDGTKAALDIREYLQELKG